MLEFQTIKQRTVRLFYVPSTVLHADPSPCFVLPDDSLLHLLEPCEAHIQEVNRALMHRVHTDTGQMVCSVMLWPSIPNFANFALYTIAAQHRQVDCACSCLTATCHLAQVNQSSCSNKSQEFTNKAQQGLGRSHTSLLSHSIL